MSTRKKIKEKEIESVSVQDQDNATAKYFRGIGRRKQATTGVKIYVSSEEKSFLEQEILINGKPCGSYFPLAELQEIVMAPLKAISVPNISKVLITVRGGGMRGQAEAARLGIARALVALDNNFKKPLRDLGYLTRDARVVERKKAGLKKARRAPQFAKR